jgi:type IV pilus assembly protein PilQ
VAQRGGNQGMIFRSIPILYANLHEILIHIQKTLQPGESAVADDSNNALVVFSGPETVAQIQSFIKLFDTRPTQILIEAQIVETTKNFARSLGVSWGETTIPHANGSTVTITNPGPSGNVSLRGLLGSIDGHLLEANLTAAESRGDAKIVSRPKVFTLNNHKAIIHSGLTYNIKTLSGVASSSAGPSANAGQLTGGITAITSGLELEVTPGVVGDGLIRLAIKVKNSEPDLGSSVDGIPGLNDNSAETSILVKGGQTATMAGLLKNTASKNTSGVPWISHIPVIGWLFSANANSDVTSELMIFLTPNIVDVTGDQPKVSAPTKSEHAPASVSETK